VVVMNQGVVEQVGPPFEIYNFPKSAFVASFVGTLNVVDATVLEPQTGTLQVAAQTIHAPTPLAGHSAGQTVKLALRPELFSPYPTETEGENCLNGIVENVIFLGAVVRIHVRVGNSLVLMDEFNNPNLSVPEIGSTIQLYFRREACLLLVQ
jgi:putative spermidine/putrescine transport system ATP-binding protein